MTISANYPQPVYVNGFRCDNCADVALAKKHIDPAHPKSGPYGIDAATDPSQPASVRDAKASVIFGGALSGLNATAPSGVSRAAANAPGSVLNLSA